jgi:hypothetical protein
MTKITKTLCLLAAVGMWQGCSSSSDDADGGKKDGGDGGSSDGPVLGLSRGTNTYQVTAVSGVTDNCEILPNELMGMSFPATFTESTQILSVGSDKGAPPMPSFGSGVVGVTGTLMRENDATNGAGCSWHQVDTSEFTLIGNDVFTLNVTEVESAFNGCTGDLPAMNPCTTTFTATFSKVAGTDAGTGG